ncbi:MAG: phage head protein [Chloroflexi bacterium]|nr:MAG: phage head protein [Chloroflexota bacterium]
MAVAAATLETYDSVTLREDLSNAENMISPTETPFISMIAGKNKATKTLHEWPLVELASPSANRVPEGEDAPAVDTPTLAFRRSNYTQISDKVVKVSDTSQFVDGAANVEDIAKQISYKLKELKRDKEGMLTANIAAVPGAAVGATTRVAAGLAAFIITNHSHGITTGAAPILSAAPNGYPATAAVNGVNRDLTEDLFNTVIQMVWTQGGDPKYALVSPVNKRVISKVFTGYATKYKSADDKKLVNSIDVYESDFGQLQIIPDRFIAGRDVFIIDPEYVKISTLMPTRQLPLARTGHTENRLIQGEYTLEVGNEKALGIVADTNG